MSARAHLARAAAPAGLLLAACAALAAAPSTAASAPAPSGVSAMGEAVEPLTLKEALDRARRANLDLRIARARLEQLHTRVAQARAALLPTLAAEGLYTHNYKTVDFTFPTGTGARTVVFQKHNQLDGSLSLTVPLLSLEGDARYAAARRTYEADQATNRATTADVLVSVAQAFYLAAGTNELLSARADAVRVARQTLSDAQARVDAGTAQRLELDRAKLALIRAQQALTEATANRDAAHRALATLLQIRSPFRVVAPPPPPAPKRSEKALVALAATLRPELIAAQKRVEAASADRTAATLSWLPTVSLFAKVRGYNYVGFSGDESAWAVGARLDWMLFDGGRRWADRDRATAERTEAETTLAKLRDRISDQLRDAADRERVRRAGLDTANHALALARETLDLVRVQYHVGRATQLDLLQAQDALSAAEVATARARFGLGLASIRLERAVGSFPENPSEAP